MEWLGLAWGIWGLGWTVVVLADLCRGTYARSALLKAWLFGVVLGPLLLPITFIHSRLR